MAAACRTLTCRGRAAAGGLAARVARAAPGLGVGGQEGRQGGAPQEGGRGRAQGQGQVHYPEEQLLLQPLGGGVWGSRGWYSPRCSSCPPPPASAGCTAPRPGTWWSWWRPWWRWWGSRGRRGWHSPSCSSCRHAQPLTSSVSETGRMFCNAAIHRFVCVRKRNLKI